MIRLYIILVSICLSTTGYAASDYKCKIERISMADGDSGHVYDMYYTNYVGKEFTVSRITGVMSGILKNSFFTSPQVIDLGSNENSFKVVSTMTKDQGVGRGSTITSLNVSEFSDNKAKPFVFMSNDMVFFGQCEHF